MKRMHSIDSFRFFAAFLVVTIHISFIAKFGYLFMPFSRMAVPFFLWQQVIFCGRKNVI